MAKTPAKAQSTAVVTNDGGFEEFAGAGMENVTANDLLIPRLSIIQALSPQLKKNDPDYIPGAEIGMIADVGMGELFPDGVWFLPVYYRKDYLEWAPRSTGKGLINIHTDPAILDECTRNEKNQPILPNGNLIAETAQFFGLNLSAGRRMCFIPMTSTQLKKARRWNNLATGEKLKRADGSEFTAPFFYRTYFLTTGEESNNEGDWSGWKVERSIALPEINQDDHAMEWRTIMDECKSFLTSLLAGEARADTASLAEEATPVSGKEGAM